MSSRVLRRWSHRRSGGRPSISASAARLGLARLRRPATLLACLLAVTTLTVAGTVRATAQTSLTASWTSWLNSGLETYADTAGQWNSGDNAVQVALPGSQALWLFNDSFYGPVDADGTVNPYSTHYVHNMILLTSGSGSSFRVNATITGPVSDGVPAPAVPPIAGSPSNSWAWPAGGLVQGSSVEAIYNVFAFVPSSDVYAPVSSEVVTMPLASLTDPSSYTIAAAPSADCGTGDTNCIQWGVSLLNSTDCPSATGLSSCTYIYGEVWPSAGSAQHPLVEAVSGEGDVGVASDWWYDTTSGWTHTLRSLAKPLGSGTYVNAVSVYRVNASSYVLLSGGLGNGIVAYYASTPRLTGASSAELFTAPGPHGVPGALAYQFHIDPAYSSGQNVVMGYSFNSVDHDHACLNYAPYYNVAGYQPEFYSFTLPSSASAVVTGSLPTPQLRSFTQSPVSGEKWGTSSCTKSTAVPAPSGFRATYAGAADIDLTWSDPGGLYQYDIRREDWGDAAAGWTQFEYPVWDSPCANHADNCFTDNADTALLIPGHTYLYEIEAWNWVGGNGGYIYPGTLVTLPAKLTVVSSGLCASVPSSSAGPGTQLDQRGCSAKSATQEWYYTPEAQDGNYTDYAITSFSNSECMVPASSASGAPVDQGSCTATAAAGGWEFRIVDNNFDFELYNRSTGLCLSIKGNSQSSGAGLVQAACSTASNAIWHSSLDY
jgi:hypothetical protein